MGKAAAAIPAIASTAGSIASLVGGGAGSPPSVNPQQLAASQAQANIASSQNQSSLQNVNTYSPYGSSVYTPFTDPTTGLQRYQLNQQLSPELQQLFQTQTGGAQSLANLIGPGAATGGGMAATGAGLAQQGAGYAGNVSPTADFSAVPNVGYLTPGSFQTNVTSGAGGQALPGVQTSVGVNSSDLVKQAQDAAYQSQTQYLDPQFAQARQQQNQSLADAGLQPGTEAYDRAQGDLGRQQQMAYQSAQNEAVAAGNQQEQALFGQAVAGGQFANQAQAQMYGQGMQNADLYNQAVLGASGQNLQAQQANLQRAQTQWQDPQQALANLISSGTGMTQAGTGTLATLAGLANVAPQWPLGIPTQGAQPITSTAPQLGAAVQGATYANTLANQAQNRNLGNLSSAATNLFGSGGLFGQGGQFSTLFGNSGSTGFTGGLQGMGLGIPGIQD